MALELLSPAGNFEKLKIALHFGADAVYLSGKKFGLRAFADNFTPEEMAEGIKYAHSMGRKVYITVNIFPYTEDFNELGEYLQSLVSFGADGIIVTDPGVVALAKKVSPSLDIHISTQANVTNGYTARFWAEQGVSRIVLARELSIDRIKAIRDMLPNSVELECFAHGAMCISYSGRCLLSNYLTGRDNNKGECVQACRWEYSVHEVSRAGRELPVMQDERGTYIFNSHDLNTIRFIDELARAGITSFKIEGRMKTSYYVGCVTNAYRRALNHYIASEDEYICLDSWHDELQKCSNRGFTSGFYKGGNGGADTVALDNSQSGSDYEFCALILGYNSDTGCAIIEQRNRFAKGDVLEVLSTGGNHNSTIVIGEMYNENGELVHDAKRVQQRLAVKTELKLSAFDILRRKRT